MLAAVSDDDLPEVSEAPQIFEREFSEWMTLDDTGLKLEDLPKPTLWRVLVLPKQPKRMSRGGIALPDQVTDAEMHLNYIGQVIALGPLAGKSEKFQNPDYNVPPNLLKAYHKELMEGGPAWDDFDGWMAKQMTPSIPRYLWDVKVGDWVIYGRYSGQPTSFRGVKFLVVNDDEITQVIAQPDGFRVYV